MIDRVPRQGRRGRVLNTGENGTAPGFEDVAKEKGKDTAKKTFSVTTEDGTEVEVTFDAEFLKEQAKQARKGKKQPKDARRLRCLSLFMKTGMLSPYLSPD